PFSIFFLNPTPPTQTYTLSLHDALPISLQLQHQNQDLQLQIRLFQNPKRNQNHHPYHQVKSHQLMQLLVLQDILETNTMQLEQEDRKSTRLNSSHLVISYAVFCLKKKKK